MRELASRLVSIRAEKSTGQIYAQNLKIIMSPVRRLPKEILKEIFVNCLPASITNNPRTAPLILSHICSFWRKVAIGIPQLWTALQLSINYHATSSVNQRRLHTRHIKQWFNYAARLPLTYSFRVNGNIGKKDWETLFETALIPFLGRVKTLELTCGSMAQLMPVLEAAASPDDFSKLRSLSLLDTQNSVEVWDENAPSWAFTLLKHAPRLKEVTLDMPSFHRTRPIFGLPWGQLTNLDIKHCIIPAWWQSILLCCTNLESCSFNISTSTYSNNDKQKIIVRRSTDFSRLKKMSLKLGHSDAIISLSPFRFPALTSFVLGGLGRLVEMMRFDATELHQRLGTLQQLSLVYPGKMSGDSVVEILRHAPNLIKLDISICTEYEVFFKELALAENFLPRLVDVDIDLSHVKSRQLPTLTCLPQIIERRTRQDKSSPVVVLQKMTIQCGRSQSAHLDSIRTFFTLAPPGVTFKLYAKDDDDAL